MRKFILKLTAINLLLGTSGVKANPAACKSYAKAMGGGYEWDEKTQKCIGEISFQRGRVTSGTPTPGSGAGGSGTSGENPKKERVHARGSGGSSSSRSANPPTARKPAVSVVAQPQSTLQRSFIAIANALYNQTPTNLDDFQVITNDIYPCEIIKTFKISGQLLVISYKYNIIMKDEDPLKLLPERFELGFLNDVYKNAKDYAENFDKIKLFKRKTRIVVLVHGYQDEIDPKNWLLDSSLDSDNQDEKHTPPIRELKSIEIMREAMKLMEKCSNHGV